MPWLVMLKGWAGAVWNVATMIVRVPVGLLVLAGALLIWQSMQVLQLKAAVAERDVRLIEVGEKLAAATDTANHNAEQVVLLSGQLKDCIGQATALDSVTAAMEKARQDYLTRARQDATRARAELEGMYARDEVCAVLRRVPVCDAVADSMRRQVPHSR
jgi:hypothetical protein